jgi:MYXO-CTERM domain-containing protein
MVPIVSTWWADVDTRLGDASTETDGVYWHIEPGLMVATWFDVGYFDQHRDLRNSFQIVMRDAVATGGAPGDVDLEFRYSRCEWTTGDASGGDGGLGGTIAFAGYDFTSVIGGSSTAFSVLPGSGTPEVLNLCTDSNVGEPGVWRLQVRSGVVTYCGNGTVDPNEECDPSASPFPECTEDCHLCTVSTCPDAGPPPDVIEQDVPPFDEGVVTDVPPPFDEGVVTDVPEFDAPPMDAGLDASAPADAARVVNRYGGGGLLSCSVPGAGPGTGTGRGALGLLLLAGVWVRRRMRRAERK